MSGSRCLALLCLPIALLGLLQACTFNTPDAPSDGGDDDGPTAVTVGFEDGASGADEISGTVMIAVVLSAPSDNTVSVAYAVTGGTATPSADFTVSSTSVTFAPGEVRQVIPVTITNDTDESEPSETIELTLSNPAGAKLGADAHTITISNEVLPRVQFVVTTSSTQEPTQSTIEVKLDKAATVLSTVSLGVSGTATPGADFAITNNQVVMFLPGETSKIVPFGEVNDALDEDDETVVLQLKSPSAGILVGTDATTTHTILDEDPTPTLAFSLTTLSQSEGTASVLATVTLSAPSGRQVTVDFAQTGGNAAGTDVTVGGTGSLTFAPGETSHDVPLTIIQDTLDEADETAVVQLSNPVNATITGPTFTLTILDDDLAPTISFTTISTLVTEGTATVTLTADLSDASGLTVTAPFGASAGTTAATPGDFTFVTPSPLSFAPGTTSQTITITIANDGIGELNEFLVVALGTPTNATLGANSSNTITIVDDDCLGTGAFRVCPTAAPTGTTTLSGALNTDTDPRCGAQPAGWAAGGQPAACFVFASTVNVNGGGLTVFGVRPLVLFATGTISISAGLNASALGSFNGPGGPSTSCKSFPGGNPQNNNNGGGGGAGASFMSKGGDGGDGNNGSANGGNAPAADGADPTILRGGCRGQDGGDGNNGDPGGVGGGAGGAVYLVASTITISGSIDVSGGGGGGGSADAGGGGGAGAGGMIVLDATTLNANGTLMANGGGGGGGADSNTNGGPGADPSVGTPTTPALGGNAVGAGGPGGNGFAGAINATNGTLGIANKGGGAGGGGGGFIKASGALGGTASAGKIVP